MTVDTDIELPQIDDYQALFLGDTPLLDVRAPIEFNEGSFPLAENFPLINDDERREIGIRYKQMGQDKAIELGHELVKDEIKQQRVNDWAHFIEQHPQGVLYCFRGGMRSKISQQWIHQQTGVIYPRVKGGYKALRRYLIDQLETSAKEIQPVMLGGRTGVGKTLFFKHLNDYVDLEGIYHHRGSVFGQRVLPQPSQIDIENALSIRLLKFRYQNINTLLFEDEAANIGSRRIPVSLFSKMKQSPLVLLETSIEQRVDIIYQEYIIDELLEHQNVYGESEGFRRWSLQLLQALEKIQRRLGGQRYKMLNTIMHDAIDQQYKDGHNEYHKQWIRHLLVDYYDPMYDYQIGGKSDRIVFKGDNETVLDYLKQQYSMS